MFLSAFLNSRSTIYIIIKYRPLINFLCHSIDLLSFFILDVDRFIELFYYHSKYFYIINLYLLIYDSSVFNYRLVIF